MIEWIICCFAPDHVIKFDKIIPEMPVNGIELNGV
jgi:hypothetical protein